MPLRLLAVTAALLVATGCAAGPDAAPRAQPSAATTTDPTTDPTTGAPTDPTTGSPTQTESESEVTPSARPFASSIRSIGPGLRERMRGAGHGAGCPVPYEGLRLLMVDHVTFDGTTATGEIVVAAKVVDDVASVFERLYDARWPIRSLRTVDAYAGDDDASMADDNSSGYNCRPVAGTDRWSDHALGTAIDLNPVENPYVTASGIFPPAGREFADVDRSRGAEAAPGVVVADDVVVRAFAAVGWEWGGTWTSSKDYQHFSLSGR